MMSSHASRAAPCPPCGARDVIARAGSPLRRFRRGEREAAAEQHRQVDEVVAHVRGGRGFSAAAQQRGKAPALVVRALYNVLDAQFFARSSTRATCGR